MKLKDLNKVAQFEKAIEKKYGELTVKNPKSFWDDKKEKDYLEQLKKLSEKESISQSEKVEVSGILISRKLIKKETNRVCPVCEIYSFSLKDNFYMNKFECCYDCYVQYVEGRENRWKEGWRPNENYETIKNKT